MTQSIRVVLADDHESVRQGLRALFDALPDVEVVADVDDGARAFDAVRLTAPDLVVIDLSMPTDGLASIRRIKEQRPATRVVVLTRHRDVAYVREAFAAGASGYVLKQSPFSELADTVRAVFRGERVVDAHLGATEVLPLPVPLKPTRQLSARETDVLRMAAQGKTNKEIAAACGIAVKTVEVHKANAMRKLNLEERGDLIRHALLHGWL